MLLICGVAVYAQQAFTLVGSEKRTVTIDDLIRIEKERTLGKKDGLRLIFTENEIRLVIVTGPEDDMLSYRIQGMRNPTVVIPSGAVMKILFVNKDGDMVHDLRFARTDGEFASVPAIDDAAGSERLAHAGDDEKYQAQELVLKAASNGVFKYFCSVRGHAKGGMWGTIAVGVQPDAEPPAKERPAGKMDHSHDGHNMPGMGDMSGMDMGNAARGMQMASVTNIADPMSREGSGTAWVPDSSPSYGRMKMLKDGGMLMLMGSAFVRYTNVGSSRDLSVAGKGGRDKADAPNMLMAMYSRPVGKDSQLGFRAMASLDALTERGYGYPLLYQSGEMFHGKPIHDRQHPHDLVTELAAVFSHRFDKNVSAYIYAGLPGEPAFGPPTFMHRISASNDPDAPIGHHWQDVTHITWGVLTGGISFGKAKFEASAFNGTEPDENRWAFDRPKLNSFSGRISVNPFKNIALQFSHAYVRDPERSEPELKFMHKTSASMIYNRDLGSDSNWASSIIWGQNYGNGERTNAFLIESNIDIGKNSIFGRFERVQKSGHELVLDHPLDHDIYWVGSLSAGYVRDIVHGKGIDAGIGGKVMLNNNPNALSPVYGGTTHGGWQFFIRIRPSKIVH